MVLGLWGRKVGMTQVFENDKVVPVTVIDVGNWVVTGIKTKEKDGYNAVQVGSLKKRYAGQKVSQHWLKDTKQYFTALREIAVSEIPADIALCKEVDFYNTWQAGSQVDVFGTTRGRGFAGVVKRWNFAGAPGSHGSTMGKSTGSIGFMRATGRVIKGKKMPGHMGAVRRVMKNLDIVDIKNDGPVVLVKGSVPGHAGSLVFIRKQIGKE